MIKHYTQIAVSLLLLSFSAQGQKNTLSYLSDPAGTSREHPVDMLTSKLDISFVPQKGMVQGTVTHTFRVLRPQVDSIFFDAPGIKIKTATLGGKAVKYNMNDKGVTIIPEKSLLWHNTDSISFSYEATPRKGLYFIGWNDSTNTSRKQIWTQGEGIDNRYWYPCYDDMGDKVITETIVRFDSAYKVLSNGAKISETYNGDGTKTWHYKMSHPHANYLVMLGIGKYDISTSQSTTGVKINNWYYPEMKDRVGPTFKYTTQMMDFLEKETGVAYPWEQYSQIPVQEFIYGAMENTTATIFGDFSLIDDRAFLDRSYIGTNAHEMAHHWFGDLITGRNDKHMWLQESFATHYSKIFQKHIFGEDQFQWLRRQEFVTVLAAAKDNRNPIAHTSAGTARIYQKGSLVLDMLKYVVGEEQYNSVITAYLHKYAYQNVETNDLVLAFQDELGVNLNWFFDEWLYRGGEPAYDVNYRSTIVSGKNYTEISVVQTHVVDDLVGLFKMPIQVQVYYADGTMNEQKEWIDKAFQTILIPNNNGKKISFVLFDPNSNVLKTVNFKKSNEELKAQLDMAPHMIDRYDALLALRSVPLNDKRLTLQEAYKKESFFANKAEIIAQLVTDADSVSIKLVEQAINDKNVKVRLAVVQNTNPSNAKWTEVFEQALRDSSYEITEMALEKLCLYHPEKDSVYLAATQSTYGMGMSIRIKWLEIASVKHPEKYLKELVSYSGPQYEFRTRINAMNALQRMNYLDHSVALNLYTALLSTNNRLASPAGKTLEYFNKQNNYKLTLKQAYQSRKWPSWQASTIEKAIN